MTHKFKRGDEVAISYDDPGCESAGIIVKVYKLLPRYAVCIEDSLVIIEFAEERLRLV